MEFIAKVLVVGVVTPISYVPQVVMSDGALQWSGKHYYDRHAAQRVANQVAKAYNEV